MKVFRNRGDFLEEGIGLGDAISKDAVHAIFGDADGEAGAGAEGAAGEGGGEVAIHHGLDAGGVHGVRRGVERKRRDGLRLGLGGEGERPDKAGSAVKQRDGEGQGGGDGGHFGGKHGAGADGERGEDEDVAAVGKRGIPTEDGEESDDEHGGGDQEVLGDHGEDEACGGRQFDAGEGESRYG